ncbi:unnamed protein product [Moneuplotes crassus]|uniref:Uncharacterized protein n=1 Tax=Euplotes crassus TaxID=5936 RepID=A0AAD1U7H3_EUPCR|nr:unnamed protein product [Moneuplotes crassus]
MGFQEIYSYKGITRSCCVLVYLQYKHWLKIGIGRVNTMIGYSAKVSPGSGPLPFC